MERWLWLIIRSQSEQYDVWYISRWRYCAVLFRLMVFLFKITTRQRQLDLLCHSDKQSWGWLNLTFCFPSFILQSPYLWMLDLMPLYLNSRTGGAWNLFKKCLAGSQASWAIMTLASRASGVTSNARMLDLFSPVWPPPPCYIYILNILLRPAPLTSHTERYS